MTMLAVRSRFNPCIGRNLAFNLAWSASTRLLAYGTVSCAVGCEFGDCSGQRRDPVSDHLGGLAVVTDGAGEEPARGDGVAAFRHVYIDDLAVVIDGAVDVVPHTRTLT